jgi:HSP20 family protein
MKSKKLEQFFKRNWPYLIVLLVVIVGIQTGWLIWMHKQINNSVKAQATNSISDTFGASSLNQDQDALSLFPDDPFQDEFFSSPFDANVWNPLQEMRTMQDRINSMFGDAFGRFSQSPDFGSIFKSQGFTPNIDIRDEDDRFVIKIDLPGADSSNVDITCEDQQLKISGSIDQLKEEHQDGTLLRRERRSGRFSRSIPLSAPVEADKMETRFDKGIMTVTIPKAK